MSTSASPPRELPAIEELAHAHRPAQLAVLGDLVQALSATTAVTHLLVRGSLATGTADRLSDVDLVVAVHDSRLPDLMNSLDALMSTTFGTLLPGWRDTIVGDLGGAGFVYLLPHDGHLLQLDLYLCPTSTVGALRRRIGPRLLWQGPGADSLADAGTRQRTAQELARAAQAPADCGSLLVQAMVLHAMLRKRLARGQHYIAYGLLHDLNATCRDVIRTALVPHSRHHGWYHLPDEVGRTATGRECLAQLTQALTSPPVPTVAQADEALDRIVRLAQRIAPHAAGSLTDEISAYRSYQQHEEGLV
ncbi:nucleotidyltransferase domain-containing protein (plasmid) [Streptomyces sp. NBC_01591]|uniref:nucleotidyltransferase domain-containing protein n=1 Tax=Streptomyces sp. NBC_01591 TaxID=2975888 RepID=UPI002DDBB366|nr:nucleotidyltransferase domain-containing protein [Streptomyces sp. NBC_01591]WSD66111.1 nucleotidyltransferase domain-containing protein [Streptomyces sp. NBC_01591]WSD73006.1 nucleotidyltransferase domain-containing protein [Streptomyces sp. NBC_01591]WSD73717.1 nucleotidyltransferase domain-containing protein [Streptomyces sp. NBC_01591]WSD74495.1 nucleotidyltransferase domain-containing protein [Streptomyces sp. NBC_01591]